MPCGLRVASCRFLAASGVLEDPAKRMEFLLDYCWHPRFAITHVSQSHLSTSYLDELHQTTPCPIFWELTFSNQFISGFHIFPSYLGVSGEVLLADHERRAVTASHWDSIDLGIV